MRSSSLVFLMLFPFYALGQFSIGVESGLTFSQYNDVRVPNGDSERGTLFSLHNDFTPQASAFIRVELAYLLKDKHSFELTAAPLQLTYEEAELETIRFANTTFSGAGIDGKYEFNTYRFSYRYRLVDRPKVVFDVGASLLLRDARIALRQNNLEAEDTDLGFVPLISFNFKYAPTTKLALLLKGDALVGPQGRAEDIFGGILYDLSDQGLQLKAGYRFIEGGADVDQVYNFAFIHFADLGLVYRFP
ncbi:MAG TPA: hypothetical protein VJ953_09615 [Saprospiraceae bacterium]|nr:hypothetical protein [Saprospiraceae bacterium]